MGKRHKMDFAIETNGLSKSYGQVRAVDSVSLRVGVGEIYGFLGLNGAGKTTTIRALLGMIRPSEGNVKVLDQIIGPHGRGPWSRIGHLVERPSAYPELTVNENLETARRLQGISDIKATSRVIEQLGLAAYAGRKAGTLSTGNLQRLGLARALLHGPELLILDEPANGLDPAGVVEIRELLRFLANERGVTVFMSSHILTEVDRLARRIGIIHEGQLIEELDTDKVDQLQARRLVIQARDLQTAASALKEAGYTGQIRENPVSLILEDARAIESPDVIARLLVLAGVPPTHLAVEQQDLEEHFLRLTGVTR
jgi:ABC-2 type transport system ATP-binding protein